MSQNDTIQTCAECGEIHSMEGPCPNGGELAKAAIEPWEELRRLKRMKHGHYLAIGFLEGLAAGLRYGDLSGQKTAAIGDIREAAVELRELLG